MAVAPVYTVGTAGNFVASSAGNGIGNATTTLGGTLNASTYFAVRIVYKVTYGGVAPVNGCYLGLYDVTATVTSTDPTLIIPISTAAANATVVSKAGLAGSGQYATKFTNNDATAVTVEISYDYVGTIG